MELLVSKIDLPLYTLIVTLIVCNFWLLSFVLNLLGYIIHCIIAADLGYLLIYIIIQESVINRPKISVGQEKKVQAVPVITSLKAHTH